MIFGHLLLLVCRDTNIILLFLMIVRTTFGLFRSASNPRRFPHFQIFSLTFARNLAPPSRAFSATMAVNLIIPPPARSFSPTVLPSACRVHILLSKMAEPRAPFAPLIILCVLCYFRRVFLRFTGLRPSTLPPIL